MKLIPVLSFFLFFSCNVYEEFQAMKAPEIEAVNIVDRKYIQVVFAAEMEENSVERAFVLKKGNTGLSGKFSWDGRKMVFYPDRGLEKNRSYEIVISTVAEDCMGNSLGEDFVYSFSTVEKEVRFYVTEAVFRDGTANFSFSSPVDRVSFYSSFSVFPFVEGSFVFGENDEQVSFIPYRELPAGDVWNVTLDLNLSDIYGNSLEENFEFRFSSAREEKGVLTELKSASGNPLELLEKDDELILVFDRSVSDEILEKPLELKPYLTYSCSWNSSGTVCRISFDKAPDYGSEVTAYAGSREFRLCFQGRNSVPPYVGTLCFYKNFSAGNPVVLNYGDSVLFESSDSACFEFTVVTAPGSVIVPVDFLKELDMRISSGNLDVDMKSIESDNPGKGITRIRLFCRIKAGTQSSVLTFSLSDALTDSLGNSMKDDYVMRINSI